MVPLHLHLHRPPPLNTLCLSSTCSQWFSSPHACIKQGRLVVRASATEGGHIQNLNGDRSFKRKGLEEGWWKNAITKWNHIICSCNMRLEGLTALKEDLKEDKQLLMVVSGLLGVAFLLLRMRGLNVETISFSGQAFFSWVVSSSRRGLPVATPLHLGQFGAMTSALDNLGLIKEGVPRFSYFLDFMLERHPISYILLLATVCLTLIFIGGFLFTNFRSFEQKTADSFWDAWACICSSSTHLKEKTGLERGIGLMLGIGGLLFYSLLTSTMTAHFKSRMEWLREGAHSEVMEEGHVLICGTNNHLTIVLRQLNKSHQLALCEGATKMRKQTVLLLSENERKVTERMVSGAFKELTQLEILTRSGSLSNTASFVKVGANKAQSIIVLASQTNKYEADAESVLTVLALQPLLNNSFGKLVVEVFNSSTAELLKSSAGLKVNTLQNLSSKILVQCSRQPGLVDIYKELLEHDKQVLNVKSFPTLTGATYRQLRRGFPQAIVCGLVRDAKVDFHPPDQLLLKESDKVLMICAKDAYKSAPESLIGLSNADRELGLLSTSSMGSAPKQPSKAAEWQAGPKEWILILGWHPRVCEMITEYDDYVGPGTELVILADTPKEEREHILSKIRRPLQNVRVNHQVGNPMSRTDIKAAILHPLPNPKSRRANKKQQTSEKTKLPLSILVITDSNWKAGDISSPDKKSVLALLLAEEVCKKLELEVNSLVAEFVDYKLGKQVMNFRPNLKAIGTDEIVGLVTAQVAEQSDLSDVWADLLSSWGDEIYVKVWFEAFCLVTTFVKHRGAQWKKKPFIQKSDIKRYLKAGEVASFAELAELALLQKEVAIGYKMGNQTVINPPSKESPLQFSDKDALVVISEYQYT